MGLQEAEARKEAELAALEGTRMSSMLTLLTLASSILWSHGIILSHDSEPWLKMACAVGG